MVTSGVSGVLVPPDDSEAVADAILGYLTQPDLSVRIGAAARERAEQFSGQRYAQEISRAVRGLTR